MQTSLEEFTKNELDRLLEIEKESKYTISAPIPDECTMTIQEWINSNIMKLMEPVFGLQDRSPASMKYLLQVVYSLSQFKHISPLTLKDDEFVEVSRNGNEVLYQNKRNEKVFKKSVNNIYHVDGEEALNIACGIVNTDKPKYEQLQLDLDV